MDGRVKSYSDQKGYGFLFCASLEQDVWFASGCVQNASPNHPLGPGMLVRVEMFRTEEGKVRAYSVERLPTKTKQKKSRKGSTDKKKGLCHRKAVTAQMRRKVSFVNEGATGLQQFRWLGPGEQQSAQTEGLGHRKAVTAQMRRKVFFFKKGATGLQELWWLGPRGLLRLAP